MRAAPIAFVDVSRLFDVSVINFALTVLSSLSVLSVCDATEVIMVVYSSVVVPCNAIDAKERLLVLAITI